MTHKTGPRPEVLSGLNKSMRSAIVDSKATISEVFQELHELAMMMVRKMGERWDKAVPGSSAMFIETFDELNAAQMAIVHGMLRPWEDETCPTCPKTESKPDK